MREHVSEEAAERCVEQTTKLILHAARWAHSSVDLERATRLREVARAYRVSLAKQPRDVIPTRVLEELLASIEDEADQLSREALMDRPTPTELRGSGLGALVTLDGGTA
ncbi:MAG: hypothetical protein ACHQ9S_19370 [Candidatus Binatia bacterium]